MHKFYYETPLNFFETNHIGLDRVINCVILDPSDDHHDWKGETDRTKRENLRHELQTALARLDSINTAATAVTARDSENVVASNDVAVDLKANNVITGEVTVVV